jgi:hypothetical protein
MEVRYSYDNESFAVNAVDQAVGETRQPAAANSWLDLWIRGWKSYGSAHCPI